MTATYTDTREFFAAYEAAATSMGSALVAEFYADPCLAAAPGFVGATNSREELLAALAGVRDFYTTTIERGPTRVVDVREQALGGYHVLATVQWTASFVQVAAPIPFEVTYVLQRDGLDGPLRIVAFVSYEDEHALLQEHGLLPVGTSDGAPRGSERVDCVIDGPRISPSFKPLMNASEARSGGGRGGSTCDGP